jgi:hypothetical protein
MKTIIAGGRDYFFSEEEFDKLDNFITKNPISEVVSGGADGVDSDGILWAISQNIPYRKFVADWQKHGWAAGPIRNRQMAEYADALIVFPGGRGTDNMVLEATKRGLKIFDWRNK